MIAADTNVIVRLLTDDEPQQARQARQLFETETILLPKTVLLEVEWVLRRLYRLAPLPVIKALDDLVCLANVRCEDAAAVRQALGWTRDGMDFADALHLASSGTASRFATFDRHMIKSAASTGLTVSEP